MKSIYYKVNKKGIMNTVLPKMLLSKLEKTADSLLKTVIQQINYHERNRQNK